MWSRKMKNKIKAFLLVRPRNTAEILEHINTTMSHSTTSQELGNLLSNDKDIVKVGIFKPSSVQSPVIEEWALRNWATESNTQFFKLLETEFKGDRRRVELLHFVSNNPTNLIFDIKSKSHKPIPPLKKKHIAGRQAWKNYYSQSKLGIVDIHITNKSKNTFECTGDDFRFFNELISSLDFNLEELSVLLPEPNEILVLDCEPIIYEETFNHLKQEADRLHMLGNLKLAQKFYGSLLLSPVLSNLSVRNEAEILGRVINCSSFKESQSYFAHYIERDTVFAGFLREFLFPKIGYEFTIRSDKRWWRLDKKSDDSEYEFSQDFIEICAAAAAS